MRRPALAVAPALALLALLAAAPEAGSQPPEGFQNLQVLPADIPRPELIETMKGFTRALGVRCQHCHVGEGDDLATFDFPSDAKEEKRAARVMLRMVQAINRDHLPLLQHAHEPSAPGAAPHGHGHAAEGAEGEAVARVTCATCHRGKPEPQVEEPPATPPAPPAAETPEPPPAVEPDPGADGRGGAGGRR